MLILTLYIGPRLYSDGSLTDAGTKRESYIDKQIDKQWVKIQISSYFIQTMSPIHTAIDILQEATVHFLRSAHCNRKAASSFSIVKQE